MEIADIIPHVEALVFASDHPLPAIEILDFLNQSQGFLEDQVNINQVTIALDAISEKYNSEFYSFEIVESGGGYQFLTKPQYHSTIARLNGDKYLRRLSKSSLETLAIIAYKQPVTKSDIESIRGVNSDYSVQKLLEKELISIKGRREDAPGKPLLYVTSDAFMDYFGLNTPDELPRIREVKDENVIQPTLPPVNPLPDEITPEKLKNAEIIYPKENAEEETVEEDFLLSGQHNGNPVAPSPETPDTPDPEEENTDEEDPESVD